METDPGQVSLKGLPADARAARSLCSGWSIKQAAGHIRAAAEREPGNFYKELLAVGFKFDFFTDRAAERLGALASSTSSSSRLATCL